MENSVFLAKVIGPYLAIVAVGMILNVKNYQRMMEDFIKSRGLIYLSGVFALIIGLLMVLFHNVWVAGWPVIITVFGWLALIKGVWLIIFPDSAVKFAQSYQKKEALLIAYMVIILALGVFLALKGYILE